MVKRTKLGLIGKDISYSFSRGYFLEKFEKMKIEDLTYGNFDIPEVEEFPFLVYQKEDEFKGFNVTIPYKQSIMKYLTSLDEDAAKIGAVNTIKITEANEMIGYNTDIYGFENSLKPLLNDNHKKALILGTGGASKAIIFVLNKLNIEFKVVSRNPSKDNEIGYLDLTEQMITSHKLIINSSPVGTHPNVNECPNIPYEYISDAHYLFDLIYNPDVTMFLKKGQNAGATIKNGLEMLELQAEKSWEIWNS